MRSICLALWLVAAVACSKGGDPCDEVISKAVARVYVRSGGATPKDSVEVIKAIDTQRCRVDHWSHDAIDCYAQAPSISGMATCRSKLAPEQARALQAQEAQVKDNWEQVLVDADALKDKLCACQDRSCADAVAKQFDALGLASRRNASAPDDVVDRARKTASAVSACHTKLGGSDLDAAIDRMTEFKDAMCKCSNSACAQRVSEEMTKWGEEQAKNDSMREPPSEADMKRMSDVTKAMVDCMSRAMSDSAPPPPPPPDSLR